MSYRNTTTTNKKNGGRKDGKNGGLSPKTIRNHHMLLKDFFDFAKDKYKLTNNPTANTSRPEVVTPKVRVLDSDEMGIFIQEVMRETQRVAILTGLFTGLRKGELLALEIDDLDLKRQSITINKGLLRVKTAALSLDNPNIKILNYDTNKKTHLILQRSPKTSSSVRELFISDALCELLIRHLFTLQHSLWPNPDNLLFPSTVGTYIDPKSYEIRLAEVSKRCEIRKVNPHALRHTLASRLVDQDTPLSIVKDVLGHASIQTTQKYLHKDYEKEREAMENMTNTYIDFNQLTTAPRLNGAKKRLKFADIQLPTFS